MQQGADPKDIEADIALNFLTGFNNEVLAKVGIRLGLRGRDLRQRTTRDGAVRPTFGEWHQRLAHSAGARPRIGRREHRRYADIYKRMDASVRRQTRREPHTDDGPEGRIIQTCNRPYATSWLCRASGPRARSRTRPSMARAAAPQPSRHAGLSSTGCGRTSCATAAASTSRTRRSPTPRWASCSAATSTRDMSSPTSTAQSCRSTGSTTWWRRCPCSAHCSRAATTRGCSRGTFASRASSARPS